MHHHQSCSYVPTYDTRVLVILSRDEKAKKNDDLLIKCVRRVASLFDYALTEGKVIADDEIIWQ